MAIQHQENAFKNVLKMTNCPGYQWVKIHFFARESALPPIKLTPLSARDGHTIPLIAFNAGT